MSATRRLTSCVLAAGWMVLAGCGPHARPGAGRALAEARDKVARKAAPTFSDGAARRFLEERLPEGADDLPWERYDTARDQMRRMDRYATAAGGFVAPEEAAAALSWTELGPGNIGGRTRALVIDPVRPGTMYAAGVSGGVWKSVNAGASWRWISDEFSHLGVAALALDPTDPRVLYAGTGESYLLGSRGNGIYRTADGGETWQHLAATANNADFHDVNDLVVSRGDPRRLYVATRTGVWRSLDRGATWTRVLEAATGCDDLVIRANRKADLMLAACGRSGGSVWRNARANAPQGVWVKVLSEPAMGRTALAVAPSKPDVIYAVSVSRSNDPAVPNGPDNDYLDSLHAVFRSADGGATWEARVRNTDPARLNTLLLSYILLANGSKCGLQPAEWDNVRGQGAYNLTIAVDPVNADRVWVGGIDLFRSDDGGRNWGLASYWWGFADGSTPATPSYVHADQHVLAFHPKYNGKKNRILYVGNDGGVFRTGNALAPTEKGETAGCDPTRGRVVWTGLNRDYGSVQFYHGVPGAEGATYLGGTQDNGVVLGSDAQGGRYGWRMVLPGDGDHVAADPEDPNILYARPRGGSAVMKSENGGATFRAATQGLSDSLGLFLVDPSKGKRLWYAGRMVSRSEDAAESWIPASKSHDEISGIARALAVSPVDSNRVMVGTSSGYIHYSTAALSSTAETEWPRSRPRTGQVSWIAFDPADPDVAYATYSTFSTFEQEPHVWKTQDGGPTWRPIDGTGAGALPDLPVHTIAVDPTRTERLFVGTDLGIFVSLDGGGSWAVEDGFSPVVTEVLHWVRLPNGEAWLFAFTHGRGAWKVRL